MKKILMTAIAALAVTTAAPAFAADMPVKAPKMVVAAPSPWDIAFGTAFTTDYRLRGVSQSNNRPAVQGYFELQYNVNDWLKLYAGIWGSSLNPGYANAEMDISGGARMAFGNFGLDLGYVYYYYPGPAPLYSPTGTSVSFGDFYAKPSYKFTDWLTVGAIFDYGTNNNNGVGVVGSKVDGYYSGNAMITLPFSPAGITISLNPEIGRQFQNCTTGCASFTYWDVGLMFNYKAATLDLRYWDTTSRNSAATINTLGNQTAGRTFVATLKFDTTWSALK
jgi:uncharacterized protein (TIGR02001 family)